MKGRSVDSGDLGGPGSLEVLKVLEVLQVLEALKVLEFLKVLEILKVQINSKGLVDLNWAILEIWDI